MDFYGSQTGYTGYTFGGVDGERMRIDSSGNVGIGTTSPNVAGVSKAVTVNTTNGSSGAIYEIAVNGTNHAYLFANASNTVLSSVQALPLLFSTTNTERMRIDASGNVGIGTTSPQARLEISGASGTSVGSRITNTTASGFTSLEFADGTITRGQIWAGNGSYASFGGAGSLNYSANSGPHVWLTNYAERMRIDGSGNLLVGTTSAISSSKFALVGGLNTYNMLVIKNTDAQSSGQLFQLFLNSAGNTAGSISHSGTTAVLYNVTSDARLKENVANADDAASLIDALQVRKFDWKEDSSHQRYGFIAQELVEVAPEAVNQPSDPDEMMGVDYSKLVPMLVKELQSLRARVAELEGK
jgi:hypothetical protein